MSATVRGEIFLFCFFFTKHVSVHVDELASNPGLTDLVLILPVLDDGDLLSVG